MRGQIKFINSIRNSPADIKEGEEGGAPAACGEDRVSTDIHAAAHGLSHSRPSGYFLRKLQPMERTYAGVGKRVI